MVKHGSTSQLMLKWRLSIRWKWKNLMETRCQGCYRTWSTDTPCPQSKMFHITRSLSYSVTLMDLFPLLGSILPLQQGHGAADDEQNLSVHRDRTQQPHRSRRQDRQLQLPLHAGEDEPPRVDGRERGPSLLPQHHFGKCAGHCQEELWQVHRKKKFQACF